MEGVESGPEAFTFLLRLLMTHFDRVDTGERYANLNTLGVCNGRPFCHFSQELLVLVSAVTGSEYGLAPETDRVLEVVWMAVNEKFPTLCVYVVPCFDGSRPEATRLVGYHVEGLTIRHLPSTTKNISSGCFFDGNAVVRSLGAPARRSRAWSWPSAIPVAFVADVMEP